MGIEKTKRDRHEYARLQIEGLLGIRPPRKPAQYRQRDRYDPPEGPVLYVGQKCILRVGSKGFGKSTVKGYLLCRIISWSEEDEGWWHRGCTLYVVPEGSSSPDLDHRIGQLTHAYYDSGRAMYGSGIFSFDAKDMPLRREAA